MEHFASEFNQRLGNGQDVRTAPRAMAKLRKQVCAASSSWVWSGGRLVVPREQLWSVQHW